MSSPGDDNTPCWDCIKARHTACTGTDDYDGTKCRCPVPHDGEARRKPEFDGLDWYDPGPEMEPEPQQ